ncbi:hypothetical protein Dalk_5248 [Desulfatibacillum aliphaticivorans]|uniref:HTH merR-type domain-containing protein n=1 Tax=Desulfatibacillum aliphaticivorans TaxID=218208 RepID=B8FED7_DESAL|nr:MerR family transcriptional regulator [Desulfatibacillum aliphaticivorans]ACL06918.1 hypothetical protein Dalk_5248 [Desulfatibacillum aliphaticivorans]
MGYSTFDVARILGIDKTRLHEWLRRGFVIPSVQQAQGRGTKSVFDKSDLYRIRLFQELIDKGINRENASTYIKGYTDIVDPWGKAHKSEKLKYFCYKVLSEKAEQVIKDPGYFSSFPPASEFQEGEIFRLVINVAEIRRIVDELIINDEG